MTEARALTADETRAIKALQRVAKRWPRTLELASMGGSLVVLPTDHPMLPEPEGMDPEGVVAYIDGIPNTGGDW